MELDDCIKNRRSVRSFLAKKVEIEKIGLILEAATFAPSSGNLQNWRFIVVDNEKKKEEIADACLKEYWMLESPVFIVVCNDPVNIERFFGERADFYATQNCAAAIENILLKAADLGLASNWVGAFDENAIKRILKLPDSIKVEAVVEIGYSKEEKALSKRYSLEHLTYFNEWGKLKELLFPLRKISKEKKKFRLFK